MSSPRRSAAPRMWCANREVALLLGLGGRKPLRTTPRSSCVVCGSARSASRRGEASQFASAGSPQAKPAACWLPSQAGHTPTPRSRSRVLSSVGFSTAAGGVYHSLVRRLWCRWFILNKLLSQKKIFSINYFRKKEREQTSLRSTRRGFPPCFLELRPGPIPTPSSLSLCTMLALLSAANGLVMSPVAPTMRAPQQAVSTVSMAADGPVCIVTGGSRGLGRAIALALGGEGCRVVVNYAASAAAAEEVVAEIKKLGGDGVAVQADMSSTEGIKQLFQATADAYDEPVGVLVNNAGITRDTLVMRMKEKQWTDVIDTNLNGVFYASQAAAKVCSPLHPPARHHEAAAHGGGLTLSPTPRQIMMKARKGRIINMASIVGKIGNPGQANYAAAKGGVIGAPHTHAPRSPRSPRSPRFAHSYSPHLPPPTTLAVLHILTAVSMP